MAVTAARLVLLWTAASLSAVVATDPTTNFCANETAFTPNKDLGTFGGMPSTCGGSGQSVLNRFAHPDNSFHITDWNTVRNDPSECLRVAHHNKAQTSGPVPSYQTLGWALAYMEPTARLCCGPSGGDMLCPLSNFCKNETAFDLEAGNVGGPDDKCSGVWQVMTDPAIFGITDWSAVHANPATECKRQGTGAYANYTLGSFLALYFRGNYFRDGSSPVDPVSSNGGDGPSHCCGPSLELVCTWPETGNFCADQPAFNLAAGNVGGPEDTCMGLHNLLAQADTWNIQNWSVVHANQTVECARRGTGAYKNFTLGSFLTNPIKETSFNGDGALKCCGATENMVCPPSSHPYPSNDSGTASNDSGTASGDSGTASGDSQEDEEDSKSSGSVRPMAALSTVVMVVLAASL